MNFEEKIIERLKRIEREVERLRVWERPAGGSGVTDHGALTGLADDDHTQYLNTTRHDVTGRHTLGTIVPHDDHGALTGLADDDHPQYLLTTAKAADSDKLDGLDSTAYVNTTSAQTIAGVKTFSSIPVLPATNPTTANQAVRKGYADATYLLTTAKAADSDKLDGLDSTAYVQASALGVWQNWTPTQTGWTALPTGTYRYTRVGNVVILVVNMTAGTSNATNAYISLPVVSSSNNTYGGTLGYAVNNGAALTGASRWVIGAGSSNIEFASDMGTGTWTASGSKRMRFVAIYEVN